MAHTSLPVQPQLKQEKTDTQAPKHGATSTKVVVRVSMPLMIFHHSNSNLNDIRSPKRNIIKCLETRPST